LFIFYIKFKVNSRVTTVYYPETETSLSWLYYPNVILDNAEVRMEDVRCYKTGNVMPSQEANKCHQALTEKFHKFKEVKIYHPKTKVLGNYYSGKPIVEECEAFVGPESFKTDGLKQLKVKAAAAFKL